MKRNFLLIITLTIIVLSCLFSACKHKPAFPKELAKYIPYAKDEKIEFLDIKNNKTIILVVEDFFTSKEEFFSLGLKYDCRDALLRFLSVLGYIYVSENRYANSGLTIEINSILKKSDTENISNSYTYYNKDCKPFSKKILNVLGDTITL